MNRLVVRMSFNAYINFGLLVQYFGQLSQSLFSTLIQFGTSGLKQQLVQGQLGPERYPRYFRSTYPD